MHKITQRKAQSSIEFVVIIAAVLFFFLAFLSVIERNTEKKNFEQEQIAAREIVLGIKNEINLASEASDGYSRYFKVDNNLLGKEYEITISDNMIYIKSNKIGMAYRVVNFSGQIQKGENFIKKQNGTIYLNI
jgi:tRNA(Met) C34 N-acetyltransferase TmcA